MKAVLLERCGLKGNGGGSLIPSPGFQVLANHQFSPSLFPPLNIRMTVSPLPSTGWKQEPQSPGKSTEVLVLHSVNAAPSTSLVLTRLAGPRGVHGIWGLSSVELGLRLRWVMDSSPQLT